MLFSLQRTNRGRDLFADRADFGVRRRVFVRVGGRFVLFLAAADRLERAVLFLCEGIVVVRGVPAVPAALKGDLKIFSEQGVRQREDRGYTHRGSDKDEKRLEEAVPFFLIHHAILRFSERMAVRCADVIIADNKGIQDYVSEVYGKPSQLIAYGGNHVIREIDPEYKSRILANYGLTDTSYAVCVCRIEPENNCHISLDAFSKSDKHIVFIGNWSHSEYAKKLKKQYSSYPNIHLLDAIYDLDILYVIRSNASLYVHGHSAGGTNPSLVEAMFFGMPIVAYDCVYNRATTHEKAYYFSDSKDLLSLLNQELDGSPMRSIAEENYTWRKIAQQYEATY